MEIQENLLSTKNYLIRFILLLAKELLFYCMLDLGEKMRKLYSANNPCQAGCKYCFASWKDIYDGQPSIQTASLDNESTLLYPCCDGELFDQTDIINCIKKLSSRSKKIYVSISTKRRLTVEEIDYLVALDKYLKENNQGFLKFSISVTTKSRIGEIEPRSASYEERLLVVEQLKNAGILTSLNIKPILPFISEQEYFEILKDFSKYTNHIMLGGLYVNPSSSFYQRYIKGKFDCTKRKVRWLDNHPEWYYVEDKLKTQKITEYAIELGMQVYQSDEDFINTIRNQMD